MARRDRVSRRGLLTVALGGVALLAGTWMAAPAGAQAPGSEEQVTVTIGMVRCFVIRRPEGALTPAQRSQRIHEVFARHLGVGQGTFTLRKAGANSGVAEILLNGDQVIRVTTNDAIATGFKKPEDLAAIWVKCLERAYEQTSARVPAKQG